MDSAKYVTQHKRIYINIGKHLKNINKKKKLRVECAINKMCNTVYCGLNT